MRIFIASSDATVHLLPITLHQIHKYWPSHPEVVIGGYTPPTFALPEWAIFHSIGKFSDYPPHRWSDGIIEFLNSQPDSAFLWTMDDFVPIAPIDGDKMFALMEWFKRHSDIPRLDLTDDRAKSGHALRDSLITYQREAGYLSEIQIVSTMPHSPYQGSFQTGLWRKDVMLKYLRPGETPAEAEIRGSDRMSRDNVVVYGTDDAPWRYVIACQHGKVVLPGPGYQAADSVLSVEDQAELSLLGLWHP